MRVLGAATLAMEAIVVILAIPVLVNLGAIDAPGLMIGLGLTVAALLLVTAGMLGRPWGATAGWVMQGLVLALGLLSVWLFVMGVVFAVLWFFALRYGRQVDEQRGRVG